MSLTRFILGGLQQHVDVKLKILIVRVGDLEVDRIPLLEISRLGVIERNVYPMRSIGCAW